MRGSPSGYKLSQADVALVFGMQKRGDRDHDIAAWFGVNQGRVAEAKDGKYGKAQAAPTNQLPPKGPPGVKGRRLRASLNKILATAKEDHSKMSQVIEALEAAIAKYDANEA
jgi:hypothetical protein